MSELKILDGDAGAKYLGAMGAGGTGDPFFSIPADFYLEVSKGNVPGHTLVNKYGANSDVDAAEDVWDGGGTWVAPTTARTHDITSTSANDTSAGTGARTIRVYGLDASWDLQEETITMNGTSNVATASAYTRIFRMKILTAGSGEVNAGDITATAQTDATVTAQITTGKGQTLMAIYTIPNAKTGYLLGYYGSIRRNTASGAQADFAIKQRVDASQSDAPLLIKHSLGGVIDGGNPFKHDFKAAVTLVEKSDVILNIEGVSDINTSLDGGFEILLVDD